MSGLTPGYSPVPPRPATGFGAFFDVPFDTAALMAKRLWIRRRFTLNLLILTFGLGPMLLFIAVWALALRDPADKVTLLSGSAVGLLIPGPIAATVLVKSCSALVRTDHWKTAPPLPRLAFRLSAEGIWFSTDRPDEGHAFGWHSIIWATIRSDRGGPTLDLDLAPNQPGPRRLIGFELVTSAPPRFLSTFGNRGPRLYLDTLAVPPPVLDAALRHYSGGRLRLG